MYLTGRGRGISLLVRKIWALFLDYFCTISVLFLYLTPRPQNLSSPPRSNHVRNQRDKHQAWWSPNLPVAVTPGAFHRQISVTVRTLPGLWSVADSSCTIPGLFLDYFCTISVLFLYYPWTTSPSQLRPGVWWRWSIRNFPHPGTADIEFHTRL